jgi:hypothetical protein
VVFEYFDMKKESEIELQAFKTASPKLHAELFTKARPLDFELFEVASKRLCNSFGGCKFPPEGSPKSKNGAVLLLRPSFSMPFIKPPNMIPCVDEEAI